MPLPTYLHLSSHGLFTSINTNAESWTYTPSLYTLINPGHFSGPYTPPSSPLCRRKRGEGEGRMEKQKPNKRKRQESGISLMHKAEASKQQLNSHRAKRKRQSHEQNSKNPEHS